MSSPLTTLLKEELAVQRTFLSAEEEVAVQRPLSYDDETDLAWDRVKHRRLVFYTALRERFIQDGRPVAEWRALIAAEEARHGEPTFISHLAAQVLQWAARTSDRGAMLGGFAAKALRWFGIVLALLGGFGWISGNLFGGAVFIGAGVVLFFAGALIGGLTAQRTAALHEQVRQPAPPAESAPRDARTGTKSDHTGQT